MKNTLKKSLSLILAILMIVTTMPFAFAADGDACTVKDCTGTYADGICSVCGGDGNKLEIDISTASAISSGDHRWIKLHSDISAAGFYGDPDGYILTGSADDLLIEAVDSLETPIEVVFDNVELGYYMNVIGDAYFTFEGTNVIGNGVYAIKTSPSTEFNITINGDVEFKGQIYSNSSDSKINVESGNVVFNLEGIRTTDIGIRPVLNVKGGTTKILSADGYRTFNNDVILHNNAKLIMESLGSHIWTDGSFKMADDVDENTYFFVKTSADGVAVPTNDLSVYYDSSYPNNKINYPYFELTLGTHDEHNYTDGKCVCGYECSHDNYTDGICDVCEYPCSHENITDGECDVCGKYIYAITHQPTKAEPYVELNDDTDATYQWYEVAGIEEITDENATPRDGAEGEYASYDAETGWTGAFTGDYYSNGYVANFFKVKLEVGQTITLQTDKDVNLIGIWAENTNDWANYSSLANDTVSFTASYDDVYNVYACIDEGTHIRAYFGEATYTAIDGETGAALGNPEMGNIYVCKVTAKDGTVLTSNVLDYSYKITHQPTEAEPYVELNYNTDAAYQWYIVEGDLVEITDENADTVSYDWGESSYDTVNGWTGVAYEEGYNGQDFFTVVLNAGDTITVEITGDYAYKVGLWDYSANDGVWLYAEDGKTTYELTAESDGNYTFYTNVNSGIVTVKAYLSRTTYTAIDGETGETLKNPEYGNSYVCKVTAKDGTVLTSNVLDYSYKITHQPTEAEPYVELNDDTDATYQWYIVEGDLVEITDESATGSWSAFGAPDYIYGTYSANTGWTGAYYYGYLYYFVGEFKEGDVINFVFSDDVTDISVMGANGELMTITGSGKEWSATVGADGIFGFYAEGTEGTTLKAYLGEVTYTAIDGETGAALKNPEYGNSYVCKVTAKDGTVLTSDVLDYSYKITHQPTETEPYVELNDDTDATYQWYTVDEGTAEITNENADIVSYDWGESSYDAVNGWTGVAYEEGYIGQEFFTVVLNAGDTITVEITGDYANGVGLWDYSAHEGVWLNAEDGKTTYELTAESDGNYTFYTDVNSGIVTVKAYLGGTTYTAIDGETGAALKNPEMGNSYVCKVTAKDGTVLTSDVLDYSYKITHQPTEAEPYVELNDDTDATYQWYIVEGDLVEITDENADTVSYDWGESSYDKVNGWTGVTAAEDPNAQEFFTVVLNAGDTITVEITGDYANGVGLWDYSAYDGVWLYAEDGKTTYELTAESDGNYTFYTYVYSGIVTVKAYLGEGTYTAIDDETGAALKNPEMGKYFCEVTFADDTTEKSDMFEITAVHTCDFTNYIESEAAKCGVNAKETGTCVCGATYTREVEDSALDHDIVIYEAVDPKCGETGLTAGQHCSRCDDMTIAQEVVPALNHKDTLVQVDAQEPTCTEIGWDAYEYCTACDYTTYKEILATNHKDTLVQVDAKAPTCTEIGWDAYEYCTACDYTTYVEIAALNHEPLDAVVENEAAATCKADGSYDSVVYCGNCDEELDRETITVPALSHADADGDNICDDCDEVLAESVEPDTPDTPDEPTDTDCDHLCHKSGFVGFIWKIVKFFWKLFKMNPVCECGSAHY